MRDGLIVSAFISADKSVEMKLESTLFEDTLLTLLGAYHAWDSTFPLAYKCLAVFDEHVCGKKLTTHNREYKKEGSH